jgi:acyl homoserine lactone synthase
MKLIAIQNPTTTYERRIIEDMHGMRARIFAGRLGWDVKCRNNLEYDEFDLLSPTYLLVVLDTGKLAGSVRLLPGDGPTMLDTVFPQLLARGALHGHRAMIESSRFCVDTSGEPAHDAGVHNVTRTLFAGIIEWGLMNGYTELATATDVRLERLLRRCGWPMQRLGMPCLINETQSIAGILPITREDFDRQRPEDYQSSILSQQIEVHRHWMAQSGSEHGGTEPRALEEMQCGGNCQGLFQVLGT